MDRIAQYHLPGLFEFYELYRVFLPLYCTHRDWFYPWCDIASLYGAPADCLWGGGRVGGGDVRPQDALALAQEYGISARLTFSNIWPTQPAINFADYLPHATHHKAASLSTQNCCWTI